MNRLPWWVWAGGFAAVAYLLYKLANKVPQAVNAATGAVAQGIANIWLSLPYFGLSTGQTILGNLKLPDGTLVPLQSLVGGGNLRQDPSNTNVYANVNGAFYQLSPSDASGNYPATLIQQATTPIGGATAGGW